MGGWYRDPHRCYYHKMLEYVKGSVLYANIYVS